MVSFKFAAAVLLGVSATSAWTTRTSFVPKAVQQSAVETNALYQNNARRSSSSLQMVVSNPTEVKIGGKGGMFTASNAENRRIVPEDVRGRPTMKIVYVVLESQYQSSMTAAAKRIIFFMKSATTLLLCPKFFIVNEPTLFNLITSGILGNTNTASN